MTHIDSIELLIKTLPAAWSIGHNELYEIDPTKAGQISGFGAGLTIWQTHFVEDLFQATHVANGTLLDVGWYPEGDEEGAFRLRVFVRNAKGEVTWEDPAMELTTRSLSQLYNEIVSIASANATVTDERGTTATG